MTISYSTDELLSKNLNSRLSTTIANNAPKPPKPPKPQSQPAPKAKVTGLGTKPTQSKKMKPVDARVPSTPASFTMGKSYEDIEKMGLAGIGGMIAGGLGRAKAAMPRFKRAGTQAKGAVKTALGPQHTATVKGWGQRMANSSLGQKAINRYSNVSPAGGKWNKKLIARDAAIGTAGVGAIGGAGYLMSKAELTEEEKRLRDIRVGTASNVFGAGMGALATYQAADAGRRKYREHSERVKVEGYKPKTAAGARIHEAMKGKKLSGKMVPLVIAGGAAGGVAGQALNGAMDANSARVFINEDRKLVAEMAKKKAIEEGLVKAVEVPVGNGTGTNLSKSWHGSNPDAAEIGLVSVGKAYRIAHPDDPVIERKRKKRNNTAAAVTGAGVVGGALAGKKAYDTGRVLNEETRYVTPNQAGTTAGQRASGAARQMFTDKGLKQNIEAKAGTMSSSTLAAEGYGHIDRGEPGATQRARQAAWKKDTTKKLSGLQRKMNRNVGLAALGAGVAYAGHKMRTD